MPKIDKSLLVRFGPEPKDEYIQSWPKGSKFLKLITLPEGIYTLFSVPSVMSVDAGGALESEDFTFVIVKPGQEVPNNCEFLDVVSVFSEMTPESLKEQGLPSDYQAVILFPFYIKQ